jgi:hypothetical protein
MPATIKALKAALASMNPASIVAAYRSALAATSYETITAWLSGEDLDQLEKHLS